MDDYWFLDDYQQYMDELMNPLGEPLDRYVEPIEDPVSAMSSMLEFQVETSLPSAHSWIPHLGNMPAEPFRPAVRIPDFREPLMAEDTGRCWNPPEPVLFRGIHGSQSGARPTARHYCPKDDDYLNEEKCKESGCGHWNGYVCEHPSQEHEEEAPEMEG